MKSQHRVLLILILGLAGGRVSALNVFECLSGLIPVTQRASLQSERKGVEKPFFEGDYLVFPEVSKGRLTGFFVYKGDQAWHYDAVERLRAGRAAQKKFALVSAPLLSTHLYQMVTQPDGLRTLTLMYLPGLWTEEATAQAPVALGATVLPVFGAIVGKSKPSPRMVYSNPDRVREDDLKTWIYNHLESKPSRVRDVKIHRTMVRLAMSQPSKSTILLREPLLNELRLRKNWIQSHNLDQSTFKEFSRLLEGPCHD